MYIFKRGSDGDWVQDAYLKASNTEADDRFGYSVAISGDYAVVGTYYEDSSATAITNTDGSHSDPGTSDGSGAAYIFRFR